MRYLIDPRLEHTAKAGASLITNAGLTQRAIGVPLPPMIDKSKEDIRGLDLRTWPGDYSGGQSATHGFSRLGHAERVIPRVARRHNPPLPLGGALMMAKRRSRKLMLRAAIKVST